MKDTDLMPFGKYKGKAMIDVPASYLLWLDREGCKHKKVAAYIADNMEILLKEDQESDYEQ